MKRRDFLKLSVGAASAVALLPQARADAGVKEIRIGYQKTGVLVIARQQAVLEKKFAARQIGIKWIEFTSGPPLLEAMSVGSVDLGAVGDTPPIFAQAANANIVYVAGSRITNGQGILVPASSGIQTIADLKGKRVGFTKGSSAHNAPQAASPSRPVSASRRRSPSGSGFQLKSSGPWTARLPENPSTPKASKEITAYASRMCTLF